MIKRNNEFKLTSSERNWSGNYINNTPTKNKSNARIAGNGLTNGAPEMLPEGPLAGDKPGNPGLPKIPRVGVLPKPPGSDGDGAGLKPDTSLSAVGGGNMGGSRGVSALFEAILLREVQKFRTFNAKQLS